MTWKQKHANKQESPSVALRGQSSCSLVLINVKVTYEKVTSSIKVIALTFNEMCTIGTRFILDYFLDSLRTKCCQPQS